MGCAFNNVLHVRVCVPAIVLCLAALSCTCTLMVACEGRVHYYYNNYVYIMFSNKCILLVRMVYIYILVASCGEGWDRCHGYVCSNCVGKCD